MSQTITKGGKSTVEERIENVKVCLANAKNHQEVAAQYEEKALQDHVVVYP